MQPISVTKLNENIRKLIDSEPDMRGVCVEGELSGYVRNASGHAFFTLKDAKSQLRCVMFRGYSAHMTFTPENGMKVMALGDVAAYTRQGAYQLYAVRIIPVGLGEQSAALEQLKRKLINEGLMDESRKKPLPAFPECVGVITSPTGAAVRDVFNVITRRSPWVKIKLFETSVQGDLAPRQIVTALMRADRDEECDTLLLVRGGGSAEDLSVYNNEVVARAISISRKPIISGVGHETDFTIADLVADRRAPTPSAAAELAVPDGQELIGKIERYRSSIKTAAQAVCDRAYARIEKAEQTAAHAAQNMLRDAEMRVAELEGRWKYAIKSAAAERETRLRQLAVRIDAASPMSILTKGYAGLRMDGEKISSVNNVKPGDEVELTLADGKLRAQVKSVERK